MTAPSGWHHALHDAGHRVVSIGKLHFRGQPGDDRGFSEEIRPMHVVDGIDDVKGLVRSDIRSARVATRWRIARALRVFVRGVRPGLLRAHRPGRTKRRESTRTGTKVLFVSFVRPHFPLTVSPHWL